MCAALSSPEKPPAPAAPAALPEFKSPTGRAKKTVVLFYVLIAIALFTIAADVYGLAAVDAGLAGEPGADSRLRTSDNLDFTSGLLYFVTWLVLAVLFLRWFYRAYKNLPALGIGMPPRSAGWAVGAWFVPIVAWVVPLFSANDIWRSGDTEARANEPWFQRPVSALVGVWWAAWVITSILGNAAGRVWWDTASDLEDYKSAYTLDLVSSCLDIVAALLAIAFVRKATQRQEARAEQFAAGATAETTTPTTETETETAADDDEDFTIQPGWTPSDRL